MKPLAILIGISKGKNQKIAEELSNELGLTRNPVVTNPFNELCGKNLTKYMYAKYVMDLTRYDSNAINADPIHTILVESEIFRDLSFLTETEYQQIQKMYVDRLTEIYPQYVFYVKCTFDELATSLTEADSFISSVPFYILEKIKQRYFKWYENAKFKIEQSTFCEISSTEEALSIMKSKEVPEAENLIVDVLEHVSLPPELEKEAAFPEKEKDMPESPDDETKGGESINLSNEASDEVTEDRIDESNTMEELNEDIDLMKKKIDSFNEENDINIKIFNYQEVVFFKNCFDDGQLLEETKAIAFSPRDSKYYALYYDGEEQLDISDYTYLEDAMESLR